MDSDVHRGNNEATGDEVDAAVEERAPEQKFVYAEKSDGDITGMCQSYDSEERWEQWLAHSLDEKSGRHVTSGEYSNNHEFDRLNLPTADVAVSNHQIFSASHNLSDELIPRDNYDSDSSDCPDEELFQVSRSGCFRRGQSLPRNYLSRTADSCHYKPDNKQGLSERGHELADIQDYPVVKCARGNSSFSDSPLRSVGGSRESPLRILGNDLSSGKLSLRQRSKSTPDLSTRGGKREETLVKKIEHTSQVKLEVCELSPGLQYKKHCVIVNESVSAKTARFEALVNKSVSPNSTLNSSVESGSSRSSQPVEVKRDQTIEITSPGSTNGRTGDALACNLKPEVSDARVNVVRHQSRTTRKHRDSVPSVSSSEDDEKEEQVEVGEQSVAAAAVAAAQEEMYRRRRPQPFADGLAVTAVIPKRSADSPSPSNGMWWKDNTTTRGGMSAECDETTAQTRPVKTDVSKLVAMFEDEIKKSEPRCSASSAKLVVRGGGRTVTSSPSKNLIDVTPEHFNKITGLQSGIRAAALKPPLPPQQQQQCQQSPLQSLLETTPRTIRYVSARKHFLNSPAKIQQQENVHDDEGEPKKLVRLTSDRLSKFQRSTQEERARLAKSVPDLVSAADKLYTEVKSAAETDSKQNKSVHRGTALSRRQELSKSRNEDEWDKILTAAAAHYGKRYENAKQSSSAAGNNRKETLKLSKSYGYLETDIDTLECRQVDQTNLDDVFSNNIVTSTPAGRSRAKSLMSLGAKNDDNATNSDGGSVDGSRAKSMEFLLDDDNKAAVVPPENQLMRDGKVPSEHELRFQKSLKNLTLPSWYRESTSAGDTKNKDETVRENNDRESNSATTRWQGLGSRSSSATSLNNAKINSSVKPVVVPKRVTADWRYIKYGIHSSRESLTPRTPSTAPDSPTDECSFTYHPSLSRWNTARMSGVSTNSFVGGSSLYRSFRQPYLGWRSSAERLSAASGHPSNSSSQCPSPSSSAISAASSGFAFRPDRANFGVGLSRWGNLGTMNLSYNTDTDSEMDFNSRPSSAMAGGVNHFYGHLEDHKSSWKPSTVENQQVETKVISEVKSSEQFEHPRVNGHCDSNEDLSVHLNNNKHVWMESSFVGKKHENEPNSSTTKDETVENNRTVVVNSGTEGVQPPDRPQGEYYAMLRNQHKNLLCT